MPADQKQQPASVVVKLDLSSFTRQELGKLYLQADRLSILGLSELHGRFSSVVRSAISDAIEKHDAAPAS